MQQEDIKHIEALNDIRSMMRKSSRFLSLSGLSGIFAGVYALGGYYAALWFINNRLDGAWIKRYDNELSFNLFEVYGFFLLDAVLVLSLSILTAYYFSSRKAKKNNMKLFDHTAWKLMWQMAVPLIAGGLLCVSLLLSGALPFIAPVMLCFYGSALFAASKFTYDDVKYLGLAQIGLGVLSSFDLGNGLFYWAVGFGGLHILYGSIMWWKYERVRS